MHLQTKAKEDLAVQITALETVKVIIFVIFYGS